uniref:Uncharacterized protein n=1 Tax=Grateloupia filicina TaxID=31455 RepID=A0A2S1FXH7_9FLOR|nr:hypothetical protein Grafi_p163 [Grateloupia filicina]AWD77473.1 hypothetical protein Grafi_p163 [Grateloupia filicina]
MTISHSFQAFENINKNFKRTKRYFLNCLKIREINDIL